MACPPDVGVTTKASGAVVPEKIDAERIVERVRREHATVRALLDDLERACAAAVLRREGALDRFRKAVWALYVTFDEHLAMEETYVAPLLRAADAWGEVRAAKMFVEHNEQRRLILELVDDTECDAKDVDALTAQAGALVDAFRTDMLVEERSFAVLLQDGGFVADQQDG
jgi:hemerythrin-like domain-containing protein